MCVYKYTEDSLMLCWFVELNSIQFLHRACDILDLILCFLLYVFYNICCTRNVFLCLVQ